ncbi:MAG TPA: hypothetical protein VIL39_06705, partial [Verrucomicrobiae bacterium]
EGAPFPPVSSAAALPSAAITARLQTNIRFIRTPLLEFRKGKHAAAAYKHTASSTKVPDGTS